MSFWVDLYGSKMKSKWNLLVFVRYGGTKQIKTDLNWPGDEWLDAFSAEAWAELHGEFKSQCGAGRSVDLETDS